MIIVKSVQVGKGAKREYAGKAVETAFFKYPVEGAVKLGRLGFAGDEQADQQHHGGPDKAALIYSAAHYPHWERFLGSDPGPAVMGENLTVEGLTEETAHIGDIYAVGGAVVQVAQPRIPCFKTNVRHDRTGVLEEVRRTGYTGIYVRALEEGLIAAGDTFRLLSRPAHAPTISFANQIAHHDRENRDGIQQVIEAEGLAQVWVGWLGKRLGPG